MKEDYLWDKNGNDPEIEKLENALEVFRYKETAPPEIPAKVVSFPVRRRRGGFRFTLAAAACIAFGIISLSVWVQVLKKDMNAKIDVAEINSPQSDALLPNKIFEVEIVPTQAPDISASEKTENSKQSVERKYVKTRKPAPVIARQKEMKTYASKQTKSAVFLTEEEKYAYNQLMLALSITSSKLKIVKDKVENVDENTAVLENAR
jgi:hypothetical protein